MDIKTIKKVLIILILCCSLSLIGLFHSKSDIGNINQISLSDQELPDKIYAFVAPNDVIVFDNLPLQQYYKYYIWVEIVTPHNCSLTITLWDPENKRFDIFENDLFYDPESGRYYEIPFGTALGGNYTIKFAVTTSENLNLYIRMEQGPMCLFDVIPWEEVEDMLFYRVTRFWNGMTISHNITFKSDYMYKFYIGRVSAISFSEDNEIRKDYFLSDPEDLVYGIYSNETLAIINEVDIFMFGTAVAGSYTIEITIYSEVEYSNICYAVIEHHKISHVVDPNQTDPDPSINSTQPTNIFSFPKEWTAGILIVGGVVIAGVIIVIVKKREKNIAHFKERIDHRR
ncbi:MAG: hypothetical protein ACFE8B_17495 [Candidatus Hermodarchaeota archaeon]